MNSLGDTSIMEGIFLGLYAIMFRFYPGAYQREFNDELKRVYQMELRASAQQGISGLCSCGLRELRDMPAAILRQHLRERSYRKMQALGEISSDDLGASHTIYPPPSHLDLLLAVLPHLLFLLPAALGQFARAWVPALAEYDTIPGFLVLVIIAGLVIAAGWLIAWRRQWPLWSASWYGYWAWLILGVLSLANLRFNLIIYWIFNNLLILGTILLLALVYLKQVRKEPLRGLLSVLFLMPVVTLSFLEFIPTLEEGLIDLGTALVVSLTVVGIMTLRDVLKGTLLVLSANLIVGVGIAYVSVYLPEYPPGFTQAPSLGGFAVQVSFYMILVVVLVTGPLAFWRVWDKFNHRLA